MKFHEVIAGTWRDNVLFTVLIELTYRCNLDCFFCYNDLSQRGKPMRLDDYIKVLDDLAAMQVMTITLSGGEPLAHPDFFEIGKAARQRGFVVRIKSNGHALRNDLARRVQDEIDPFIIEISLHGGSAKTHDRQTRIPGSFERLLENLKGFRDLGLRFKLNSALTVWNEGEIREMFAIADSLGATLQFDPTVTPRDDGNVEPLDIAASPDGLRSLVRIQFERARQSGSSDPNVQRPAQDADLAPPGPEKHCGAGSSTIAIDPFGNVYPCVAWRSAVGNLHNASIQEIWTDPTLLPEFRQATVAAKDMLESEGTLGTYLAFCPGLAVNRTGRPDIIPDEQRERGKTLRNAFESELVNSERETK